MNIMSESLAITVNTMLLGQAKSIIKRIALQSKIGLTLDELLWKKLKKGDTLLVRYAYHANNLGGMFYEI